MIDDSMKNNRYIGMIQPKRTGDLKKPDLHKVGCIGKITSFNETKDGRYLINLEGINLFLLKKEINKNFKFRIIEATSIKHNSDNLDVDDDIKKSLLNKYKKYIKNKKIDLNISELEKLTTKQLARLIAMVSPSDYVDKQMLLEISLPNEFCKKLISILDIELVGSSGEKIIN